MTGRRKGGLEWAWRGLDQWSVASVNITHWAPPRRGAAWFFFTCSPLNPGGFLPEWNLGLGI